MQFSSILIIDEFKFFKISSHSLFCPILSKLSINSRVRSYSTKSCTLFSQTSIMISLDVHVLWTIVMKYLVNLSGISCTGCLKMSFITWVNASTRSLQQIIRAFYWFFKSWDWIGCSFWLLELVAEITSLRATNESTLLRRSPSLSCLICSIINFF